MASAVQFPSARPSAGSPSLQLSPSRKAIADKFAELSAHSPSKRTIGTSGRPTSPFKKPLLNTSRGNRREEETAPLKAKVILNQSSNEDVSMTLHLSRGPNTSMAEFDLMGSAEDSFLAEARHLGDETFDKKLLEASPKRGIKRAASVRKSAGPSRIGTSGSTLGLGRPSSKDAADSTISLGLRSLSNTSETSNIFDEQGEESLLYASALLDRAMPGGKSSDKVKMLEALAEYRGEVSARARPHSMIVGSSSKISDTPQVPLTAPLRASVTEGVRARTTSRPSASSEGLARATTSSAARVMVPANSAVHGVPATPRQRVGAGASSETPRTATQVGTTPRSRPPLNASAARMRRLSGLPQLVAEDGSMKPPQAIRAKVTLVGSGAAPASSTSSSSSSLSSSARPRERPHSMIGRPSLGAGAPSSSSSTTARVRDLPSSTATSSRPFPSSSSSPRKVVPRPSEALTGQLTRRPSSAGGARSSNSGSVVSSSSASTGTASAGSSSVRKPPRPFLLGAGTNQSSASTSSSSSSGPTTSAARTAGSSPRKSHIPMPSSSSSQPASASSSMMTGVAKVQQQPQVLSRLPRASLIGSVGAAPVGTLGLIRPGGGSDAPGPVTSTSSAPGEGVRRPRPMSMIARPSIGAGAAPGGGGGVTALGRRVSFGYRKADE
ncbi:hypothetical protein BCV69DRAFT_47970 [Microstroma glucosiphilum]|uniref:Uncharacterized protein n=1 Tax=Pseudomicrostroma glucosiphilum TaxID=1684307 RepID=A0A316U301_9BASI|nr:hypothetical protein BCV69DRAFT_47970 [Pseudomicrostroma glucosiphilum]PWN19218.1 hypothetical protein BCV69DRAFT_47970 [Pseudomicrostroma glucosiphilum]